MDGLVRTAEQFVVGVVIQKKGRQESNLRSSGHEPDEMTDFSTPHGKLLAIP